jgi:hypothetical protein
MFKFHMKDPEKINRIIKARMKLKARFEEQMKGTLSVADGAPKGCGKPNHRRMPELTIRQIVTHK